MQSVPMLYLDRTFPLTLPSALRLSSSFSRVLLTLNISLLTVPTQTSEGTPISIHSLLGGGVVRAGDLYQRGTQKTIIPW